MGSCGSPDCRPMSTMGGVTHKEVRGRTKGRPLIQRESLVAGLQAMAPALEDMATQGGGNGVGGRSVMPRCGGVARAT